MEGSAMKEYRPDITIPKSTLQKIANAVGYGVFIVGVLYSIVSLTTLPSEVPIHFNFAGEADGWGSKYVLLLLPFIGIVTVLALEAVEKRPHMHNYPHYVNEANVRQFYAVSVRTMNLVKNGTLLTFGLVQIEIVQSAKEAQFTFGATLVGIIVLVLFVPIVWHLYSSIQLKPTKDKRV